LRQKAGCKISRARATGEAMLRGTLGIHQAVIVPLGLNAALGQNAKYSSRVDVFRSTPESGLKSGIALSPKSANFGSGRCALDALVPS
jgi:hypothetical protein